jgi:hypothetical protein
MVFDAPIEFERPTGTLGIRDPWEWTGSLRTTVAITSEGVMPFMRWVVRNKGKSRAGKFSPALHVTPE